jgi:hypothetical protein
VSFKYRIGDVIKSLSTGEEGEVVGVDSATNHYELKLKRTGKVVKALQGRVEDPKIAILVSAPGTATASAPPPIFKYKVGDVLTALQSAARDDSTVERLDVAQDMYHLKSAAYGQLYSRPRQDVEDHLKYTLVRSASASSSSSPPPSSSNAFRYSIGDVVDSVTDRYTIVDIDPVKDQYKLKALTGMVGATFPMPRSTVDRHYKLVSQPLTGIGTGGSGGAASAYIFKFKVGDVLAHRDIAGFKLKVTDTDRSTGFYRLVVVSTAPQCSPVGESKRYEIETVEKWYILDIVGQGVQVDAFGSIARNQDLKPCMCDSKMLFNKGCQCGAVAKKQWGLRA